MSERMVLDDYVNFKRYPEDEKDKIPPLPIEELKDLHQVSKHHGAFTTAIELDDEYVIKLNRVVNLNRLATEGEIGSQLPEIANYLTKKSEEEGVKANEIDREEAIQAMTRLARVKREGYETLGEYIGPFLPEIKFFAIVESPRRELEKSSFISKKFEVSEDVLEKIPDTEMTLMEVWENVHPQTALSGFSFEGFQALRETPQYSEQAAEFATQAFKLLKDKRIELDIVDRNGIQVISPDRKAPSIRNLRSTREYMEGKAPEKLPYPRNVCWINRKLVYFDTYPLFKFGESVTDEMFTELIKVVGENKVDDLERLFPESLKETKGLYDQRMEVLHYLLLLKSMGAKIE